MPQKNISKEEIKKKSKNIIKIIQNFNIELKKLEEKRNKVLNIKK